MKNNVIEDKSFGFAVRIINLYKDKAFVQNRIYKQG